MSLMRLASNTWTISARTGRLTLAELAGAGGLVDEGGEGVHDEDGEADALGVVAARDDTDDHGDHAAAYAEEEHPVARHRGRHKVRRHEPCPEHESARQEMDGHGKRKWNTKP